MSHLDATGAEVLSRDEQDALAASLAEIGPWALIRGTHGVLRAERGGTSRCEQASATAEGLLTAVRTEEARLARLSEETPTLTVHTLDAQGEPIVLDEHKYSAKLRNAHVVID